MTTLTMTIDDRLAERLRTARGGEVDLDQLATIALAEAAERWEREAAARAEARASLNGPHHQADPDATYQNYKAVFGWNDDDFSHLSGDELIDSGDRLLDAMPPEKLALLKRGGWL